MLVRLREFFRYTNGADVLFEKNIVRLNVAVDEPAGMHVPERLKYREADGSCSSDGEVNSDILNSQKAWSKSCHAQKVVAPFFPLVDHLRYAFSTGSVQSSHSSYLLQVRCIVVLELKNYFSAENFVVRRDYMAEGSFANLDEVGISTRKPFFYFHIIANN